MAAITQSRCLTGSRMFIQTKQTAKIANGSKYFMRRKDSYMVEVNVAETETEDQAVRRYMRAVVQSGVLNKLRARRTKETKIETYKRKQQERAQARKLGIEEPTWEEFYGANVDEAKPFDEFFEKAADDDDFMQGMSELPVLEDAYFSGTMYDLSNIDPAVQGGFLQDQGGYINQQGGYINQQGDYLNQQPLQDFNYTAGQQMQQ